MYDGLRNSFKTSLKICAKQMRELFQRRRYQCAFFMNSLRLKANLFNQMLYHNAHIRQIDRVFLPPYFDNFIIIALIVICMDRSSFCMSK